MHACQRTRAFVAYLRHVAYLSHACTLCRRSHEAARSLPLLGLCLSGSIGRKSPSLTLEPTVQRRKVLLPERFRRLNSLLLVLAGACDEMPPADSGGRKRTPGTDNNGGRLVMNGFSGYMHASHPSIDLIAPVIPAARYWVLEFNRRYVTVTVIIRC
jgi:hypothetical protein